MVVPGLAGPQRGRTARRRWRARPPSPAAPQRGSGASRDDRVSRSRRAAVGRHDPYPTMTPVPETCRPRSREPAPRPAGVDSDGNRRRPPQARTKRFNEIRPKSKTMRPAFKPIKSSECHTEKFVSAISGSVNLEAKCGNSKRQRFHFLLVIRRA